MPGRGGKSKVDIAYRQMTKGGRETTADTGEATEGKVGMREADRDEGK